MTLQAPTISAARGCAGICASGRPCRAFAMQHSEYCFFHDPRLKAKHREAARLGGTGGRKKGSPKRRYQKRSLKPAEILEEKVERYVTQVNAVLRRAECADAEGLMRRGRRLVMALQKARLKGLQKGRKG